MILDSIVRRKRLELKEARAKRSLADLRSEARSSPPLREFESALRTEGEVSIIAEIKRTSPRTGPLVENLSPASFAKQYEEGGARAISVLTDEKFFHGSFDDLAAARDAVSLPVLRKDFLIDEYQLWESRVRGADAILLIARILEPGQLADYVAMAKEEMGLPALVEVHDEKELDQALDAKATIIGINNRDLDTLEVRMETTLRLRDSIPGGILTVSESGISDREDMVLLRAGHVDAALIGEHLVTSENPVLTLNELRGTGNADARNPRRD